VLRLKLLDKLEEQWKGCERCDLSRSRARIVHWRGSPDAPLFVIGEAPSAAEDAEGLPFVGGSGQMLDLILKQAGLGNEHVFMANVVGCRPPGGRMPEREEAKACVSRLQVMLRIVRPRALLLLGSGGARLAGIQSVAANRGQITSVDMRCYDGEIRSWPAVVTWSPAFVMRSGGQDARQFQEALSDVLSAWKLVDSVDLRPML